MKQLFLAFLLLILAGLLVPPLRQRAQPHIDEGREWLGSRMEGPMAPLLDPYRRLKSRSQMGQTVSALIARRNMGYPPPKPDEIRDFMTGREFAPDGLDAWGAPYILRQRRDSLDIISAGPDIQYDTEDDLVVSMRYRDRGSSRRRPRR